MFNFSSVVKMRKTQFNKKRAYLLFLICKTSKQVLSYFPFLSFTDATLADLVAIIFC